MTMQLWLQTPCRGFWAHYPRAALTALRVYLLEGALVGAAIVGVASCEDASSPTQRPPAPNPAEPTKVSPAGHGSLFGPTLARFKPPGSQMAVVAEVGNPDNGTMLAVIATHTTTRTPALRLELWTFDQRGEDETLQPRAAPAALVPIHARGEPVGKDLARVRRFMAAAGTSVYHPQGVDSPTATAAFEQLRTLAKQALKADSSGQQQVDALAALLAGLDDKLWLRTAGPTALIAALAGTKWSVTPGPAPSAFRAQLQVTSDAGQHTASLLKKKGGWVLAAWESRAADTASARTP